MSERRRRGLWVGMLLALVAPSNSQGALRTLENIEELPLDRNKHLANHWLLIPFSCRERLGVPDSEAIPERELAFVVDSSPLGKMFFSSDSCETPAAIALERGTNRKHIQHHFERFEYPKPVDADNGLEMRRLRSNFQRWLQSRAIVEVGFINYLAQGSKVRVLWVEPGSDNEVLQGDVEYGEQSTHWREVFLGHQFRVRDVSARADPVTGLFPLVGEMVARKNEIFIIGKQPPLPEASKRSDYHKELENTDRFERRRAKQVLRTFTEHGFSKVKVPPDIFGSIHCYYYNNQQNAAREEWEGKGFYVNWWESDPWIIPPPFGLKKKWHDALRPLAEEWIGGVELENTDLYGIRKYTNGAKLVKHVDRETTHGISMIINIDQSPDMLPPGVEDEPAGVEVPGTKEPWLLEVHDHQTDYPEFVNMAPGDMVFYESARCLHGRPEALAGQYYVNLFVHYRPRAKGSGWYREQKATAVLDGKMVPLTLAQEASSSSAASSSSSATDGKILPRVLLARENEAEAGHQNRVTTEMRELKISAKKAAKEAAKRLKKQRKGKKAEDVGLLHPPSLGGLTSRSKMGLGDKVAKEALEKLKRSTRNRKDKEGKTNKNSKQTKKERAHSKRIRKLPLWWLRVALDKFLLRPLHLGTHLSEGPLLYVLIGVVAIFAAIFFLLSLVFMAYDCLPQKKSGKRIIQSDQSRGCSEGQILKRDALPENVARAAANGKTAIMKQWVTTVIKEGGSVDVVDKNERTALALAAKGGHDTIVRLLLAAKCDVSPTDKFGRTPLHLAASAGRGPCVKLLLEEGAQLWQQDVDNATALQLAKMAGNVGCTVLLERAEVAVRATMEGSSHGASEGAEHASV